jgi:hypothetical protein
MTARAGGRLSQLGQVNRVAGQDPVAGPGQQYDGGVNGVAGLGGAEQDASGAADLVIDGADVNGAKQPRQPGLPPVRVTPGLGRHHRVTAQFQSVLLSGLPW